MRRGEKKKRRMSEEKERGEENENRGSGKRWDGKKILWYVLFTSRSQE